MFGEDAQRYSLASSALATCAVIAGQSELPSSIFERDIALIAFGWMRSRCFATASISPTEAARRAAPAKVRPPSSPIDSAQAKRGRRTRFDFCASEYRSETGIPPKI